MFAPYATLGAKRTYDDDDGDDDDDNDDDFHLIAKPGSFVNVDTLCMSHDYWKSL